MVQIVSIVMIVLTIGFLGTWVAQKLKIPHSVFLVIFGITAGIIAKEKMSPGLADFSQWISASTHFPDLVLYVLLPPLIFESAYHLDFLQMRRDIFPIGVLSVFALIISTFLIGQSLHLFFNLESLPCYVFGALISATDPVAVVALFKEVGAPRRLVTMVEGESLLNDGTAIVVFRLLLGFALLGHMEFSVWKTASDFFWICFGGMAVGLTFAFGTQFLFRTLGRKSSVSQIGISLVAAYSSFIVADHEFGFSGVISTMTVGLFLGHRSRMDLTQEALDGMKYLWEFLALCANTVVFLVVGVAVDLSVVLKNIPIVLATIAIVYLSRALSVFGTLPSVNATGFAGPISFAYQAAIFWGGLRGGLALGLVLLLPQGFPHKELFLALTTSVVVFSLIVNALTTPLMLRFLGLDRLSTWDESFLLKSIRLAEQAAFGQLDLALADGLVSPHLIENEKRRLIDGFSTLEKPDTVAETNFAMSAVLQNELRNYERLLDDHILSREAYSRLADSILRRLEIFQNSGINGLTKCEFKLWSDLVRNDTSKFVHFSSRFFGRRTLLQTLSTQFECLLHLKQSQDSTVKNLELPQRVLAVVKNWQASVDEEFQLFLKTYSDSAASVQFVYVTQMLKARATEVIEDLHEANIISTIVKNSANVLIAKNLEGSEHRAAEFLRPPGTS